MPPSARGDPSHAGGGSAHRMSEKETRETILNEADNGRANSIGTVAMARTSDPDSASSQFFINVADNNFLNHTDKTDNGWGYAVFGEVSDGMEVVDNIKSASTGSIAGLRPAVPPECTPPGLVSDPRRGEKLLPKGF